jgi:predicted O-methyltransferase YrrM
MSGKFGTLLWFLRRPRLYPHMMHLVSIRLSPSSRMMEDTGEEALEWCKGLAVDTYAALERLTGSPSTTNVRDLHRDYYERAERTAAECPVEMGGPGNLDLLYWCAEHLKAEKVIETGVAFGWSSLTILLSLRNRPGSRLISSDMPYRNRDDEKHVGCIVPDDLRSSWRILRYADRQAVPRALKTLGTIDICHYDSDKSYDGMMWAYPRLWKALRPGGFFISDDIGDNVAFRDFSRTTGCDPVIVNKDEKYMGVIVKPLL